MSNDILKIVNSMGYRACPNNKWLKPIGHEMYVIIEEGDNMRIGNFIKPIDGDIVCYSSESTPKEEFTIETIKDFETYSASGYGGDSSFEFNDSMFIIDGL